MSDKVRVRNGGDDEKQEWSRPQCGGLPLVRVCGGASGGDILAGDLGPAGGLGQYTVMLKARRCILVLGSFFIRKYAIKAYGILESESFSKSLRTRTLCLTKRHFTSSELLTEP